MDLILLQSANLDRPSGSAAWMAATQAARLFHLRENGVGDLQRLARVLDEPSVARTLAEAGRVRARRFTWDRAAADLATGYRAALGVGETGTA